MISDGLLLFGDHRDPVELLAKPETIPSDSVFVVEGAVRHESPLGPGETDEAIANLRGQGRSLPGPGRDGRGHSEPAWAGTFPFHPVAKRGIAVDWDSVVANLLDRNIRLIITIPNPQEADRRFHLGKTATSGPRVVMPEQVIVERTSAADWLPNVGPAPAWANLSFHVKAGVTETEGDSLRRNVGIIEIGNFAPPSDNPFAAVRWQRLLLPPSVAIRASMLLNVTGAHPYHLHPDMEFELGSVL